MTIKRAPDRSEHALCKSCRGENRCNSSDGALFASRNALNCDHRYVVLLSEVSGSLHDVGGWLSGDGSGTIKSEEFAVLVLGLDHAVRVESESAPF